MNWLNSLISLGAAALSIFTPNITQVLSGHPKIVAGVAAAWAIWNHVSPAPTGAAVVPETGEKGTATSVK